MGSYDWGKAEVCAWIREHFAPGSSVLDVGACDGKWRRLLPEYVNMDAVEVYAPNLVNLGGYRKVFHRDIRDIGYDWYDLIIFGDIVEHLTVEEAQRVLAYAKSRCRDMVIAVPFRYVQGAIYGNPYEVHVQDDLTAENFEERYPGYAVLCDPAPDYRYYHKGGTDDADGQGTHGAAEPAEAGAGAARGDPAAAERSGCGEAGDADDEDPVSGRGGRCDQGCGGTLRRLPAELPGQTDRRGIPGGDIRRNI